MPAKKKTTRYSRRKTASKVTKHKKAAKKADREADSAKRSVEFYGGKDAKAAKKRTGGKSLLARGNRSAVLEKSKKVVKKRLEAAKHRGAAKKARRD